MNGLSEHCVPAPRDMSRIPIEYYPYRGHQYAIPAYVRINVTERFHKAGTVAVWEQPTMPDDHRMPIVDMKYADRAIRAAQAHFGMTPRFELTDGDPSDVYWIKRLRGCRPPPKKEQIRRRIRREDLSALSAEERAAYLIVEYQEQEARGPARPRPAIEYGKSGRKLTSESAYDWENLTVGIPRTYPLDVATNNQANIVTSFKGWAERRGLEHWRIKTFVDRTRDLLFLVRVR